MRIDPRLTRPLFTHIHTSLTHLPHIMTCRKERMKRMRVGRLSRAVLEGGGHELGADPSASSVAGGGGGEGSIVSHQPFR